MEKFPETIYFQEIVYRNLQEIFPGLYIFPGEFSRTIFPGEISRTPYISRKYIERFPEIMRADFEKLVQSDDQDPPFRVI